MSGSRARRGGLLPQTSGYEPVAEEPLGIDGVVAQLFAQLLAQLADVALDHVLLGLVVEDAVARVEDLRRRHAAPGIAREEFQDAPCAPRQRQRFAVYLGVAPVDEDAHRPEFGIGLVLLH